MKKDKSYFPIFNSKWQIKIEKLNLFSDFHFQIETQNGLRSKPYDNKTDELSLQVAIKSKKKINPLLN